MEAQEMMELLRSVSPGRYVAIALDNEITADNVPMHLVMIKEVRGGEWIVDQFNWETLEPQAEMLISLNNVGVLELDPATLAPNQASRAALNGLNLMFKTPPVNGKGHN